MNNKNEKIKELRKIRYQLYKELEKTKKYEKLLTKEIKDIEKEMCEIYGHFYGPEIEDFDEIGEKFTYSICEKCKKLKFKYPKNAWSNSIFLIL